MRRVTWPGLLLVAGILFPVIGNAEETGTACDPSVENAALELQKADNDPAEALKGWLRRCPPGPDLRKKYTAAIEKALPAAISSHAPSDPTQKNAPPQNYQPPFGTFAQHGHATFKDRSGWFEWDDTLVIHKDGTADMTTQYDVNFYTGWHLTGCSESMRVASDVWTQHFRVLLGPSTVTLYRQGPMEVSDVEPSCWQHSENFNDPWHLDWIDGHLKSGDGEYLRQN